MTADPDAPGYAAAPAAATADPALPDSPSSKAAGPGAAMVVDDHPITHLGCGRLLADMGYAPVLRAMTGAEALALLESHRPAVVILDIALPSGDAAGAVMPGSAAVPGAVAVPGAAGLSLIAPILQRSPASAILMFSMNDQPGFAARALDQGARGFLSKNADPDEFKRAVRTVAAGEYYLSQRQAVALAVGGRGGMSQGLTDRETQVLALIGQGLSLQEVADRIGVSYKTVANTSSALKRKLGVSGMTGLIRHAVERG